MKQWDLTNDFPIQASERVMVFQKEDDPDEGHVLILKRAGVESLSMSFQYRAGTAAGRVTDDPRYPGLTFVNTCNGDAVYQFDLDYNEALVLYLYAGTHTPQLIECDMRAARLHVERFKALAEQDAATFST